MKHKTESIHRIKIPVIANGVLSPQVHYGVYDHQPLTGIYFKTADDNYGRITFENLDALKVSRGEMLPLYYDWSKHQRGTWVFKVENSRWQQERYAYEKEHYGDSYEFGGNVEDMKTLFSHYIFSFHDEFVEAIAKGFWFEESPENLFGKDLTANHPFLSLKEKPSDTFATHGLSCKYWTNDTPKVELLENTQFCTQKLMEFALEFEGNKPRINHTLKLTRNEEGKPTSILCGFLGNKIVAFSGIADLEDVKPYISKYMKEVAENRLNKK